MSNARFSSRLVVLPLALAVALLAAADQAAAAPPPLNLLVNPDFDKDLSGWTIVGAANAVGWTPGGQGGNLQSGSAYAYSPSSGGGALAGLVQCVNLPTGWRGLSLDFNFWMATGTPALLVGGSYGNGMAVLSYYDKADCGITGAVINPLLNLPLRSDENLAPYATDGAWRNFDSGLLSPPDSAQSVLIHLAAVNTAPNTSGEVYFDTVFFGYTPASACGGDPSLLCVDDNRFQVTAQFALPCDTGSSSADGAQITADGGFLWCFDPANPEIFVKVLNACTPALGNTYWVFISGLTNVGVTVTVTDTKTGQQKSYTNPNNHAFVSIEDTAGLEVCP
jgi:hypothetical protein